MKAKTGFLSGIYADLSNIVGMSEESKAEGGEGHEVRY